MSQRLHFFLNQNAKRIKYLLALPVVLAVIYFLSNRFLAYPLQFTSPQNVLREPPIFHLDEPVTVEAVFVNSGQEDVGFAAAVHWVLVSPIRAGEAQTDVILLGLEEVISPGCREIEFVNFAPRRVKEITQELFAAGHSKVTWRLTGHNVITESNGRGSMAFSVDEFSYIPEAILLPPSIVQHDTGISCDKVSLRGTNAITL